MRTHILVLAATRKKNAAVIFQFHVTPAGAAKGPQQVFKLHYNANISGKKNPDLSFDGGLMSVACFG